MKTSNIISTYIPYYTYDDYVQWEGRWELIHGIPVAMSPAPSRYHQRVNSRIITQLGNKLEDCNECEASIYVDFKIGKDIVFQPDALVLCGPVEDSVFITKAPAIIFEILSKATRQKDLTVKYKEYEKAGVKYYVIVDPIKKICSVFQLVDGEYKLALETGDEAFDFSLDPCQFSFDFGKIW